METIKITGRLITEERETLLNYDLVRKMWTMDTTVLKHYNRAVKQKWTMLKQYIYDDGSVVGGVFEAPDRAITIRSTDKKVMSDKQMGNLCNDNE